MDVMRADTCALVLVDYQARLMPAIHGAAEVVSRAVLLARVAHLLDVPVLGTEQNPSGLGPNVEEVRGLCRSMVSKIHFDACSGDLVEAIQAHKSDCREVVLAGCEAHVCMMQTGLGLRRAGKRVWVVEDASGSRRPADHSAAMRRLADAGATIVTHEMVIFEWLYDCRHPRFREALSLIKAGA